jgi:energy-coupling factor transport system permease protein
MSKELTNIYPLTKILLIFVYGSLIIADIPLMAEALMIILLGLLFIHNKNIATAVKVLIIFLVLLWIDGLKLEFLGNYTSLVHSLCFIVRRFMLPIMTAKYAMNSTSIGAFMGSLEKLKVPNTIIVPFAVMFRFFPSLKEEFACIKNAMKMRGISLNVKNIVCSPINCLEYVFVPMLASSSKLGDELAAAAHTKGVDDPCKKVRYKANKLSIMDVLIGLYLIGVLIFVIWSNGL